MVFKHTANPRLHPTEQKGLTVKFPTEINLLQEECSLTSILATFENYNQYYVAHFVASVTFYRLEVNDEQLCSRRYRSDYVPAKQMHLCMLQSE